MNPAALPGGVQDFADRCLQPFIGIADHPFGAAQATPGETAQELDPERLGLAVPSGHAENFPPAIGVDADGHDDRHGDDLVVAADLHVGGIEPDIWPVAFDGSVKEGIHAVSAFSAMRRGSRKPGK